MDQGWVKLHRQLGDNSFLMHDDKALLVFIKLLIHVNKKGEIAAGRRQLGQLFNINDRTLYDVLVRLENEHIIDITSNAKYSIFRIKNWQKYQSTVNRGEKSSPTASPTASQQIEMVSSPTAHPTRAQPETNRSPTTDQHSNKNKKENKKENATNVALAKTPSADINAMFVYWENQTGIGIHSNTQKNRYACSNLLKRYGLDKTKQLVDGVVKAQSDRYAPRISDFVSLQSKLNDLLVWGRNQLGKKTGVYKV